MVRAAENASIHQERGEWPERSTGRVSVPFHSTLRLPAGGAPRCRPRVLYIALYCIIYFYNLGRWAPYRHCIYILNKSNPSDHQWQQWTRNPKVRTTCIPLPLHALARPMFGSSGKIHGTLSHVRIMHHRDDVRRPNRVCMYTNDAALCSYR